MEVAKGQGRPDDPDPTFTRLDSLDRLLHALLCAANGNA
jgi:hypothetical protein